MLPRLVAAISGTAVYIDHRHPLAEDNPEYWNDERYRGRIVVARIANDRPVSHDTIYNRNYDQGLAQYAAVNFDGQKIAFFRWSTKLERRNGKLYFLTNTDNGPHYISVINADGTGLTNLLEVERPCGSFKEIYCEQGEAFCLLDWAQGDWIYYEKPQKTNEIRRINAFTKVDQHVADLPSGGNITRFTMSIDANWAAGMSRGGPQSGQCGATEYNSAWKLPSLSPSTGEPGCNIAISTMGNFLGFYGGGNHEKLFIQKWDHATNKQIGGSYDDGWHTYEGNSILELEGWMGGEMISHHTGCGGGAEVVRWAVNSDKWALRQIGWIGQASDIAKGTNMIAVNWKDHRAVNVSKTPRPPDNWCNTQDYPNTTAPGICADAGDLWIDFGAGNRDKWEDEGGALHDYPFTYTHTNPTGVVRGRKSRDAGALMITRNTGGVLVQGKSFLLTVTDSKGRMMHSETVTGGECLIPADRLPKGVCLVSAHAPGSQSTACKVITGGR